MITGQELPTYYISGIRVLLEMIPKSIVVFRVAVEGTTKSSTRYQIHIKLSYMADIIRRIPDIVLSLIHI